MAPALHRLVARAVAVGPDELRALLWSFAYFFCLLAGYYVLRPLRDQMGIAGGVRRSAVSRLPRVAIESSSAPPVLASRRARSATIQGPIPTPCSCPPWAPAPP